MSSETKDVIKLGLLSPLTGIVECYGQEISWAGQIATDIVNEEGGILGRPLELIIADDGSIPETAVPAARKLITHSKCDAIIGNLLSNARISVAGQVAEPLKVPYLNFSFYEGSISSPYFFSFSALPNQQIDKMIPYMATRFGPKMFFAGSDYEWPRGSIDAAKKALVKLGGEIVGEQYLPLGNADMDVLLYAVARSGADVFVPYFAGLEQIDLLSQFARLNLKNKMAVVMGHYDEIMASQLEPHVRQNLYSSNSYFMSVNTPENTNYLRRLAARHDVSAIWPAGNGFLTNFGEGTYVCVRAYADAVNRAGTLDTDAVLNALKTVKVHAPQGVVRMDPETQHAAVNCYLTQCQQDGNFKIIENFGIEDPVIPKRYRGKESHETSRKTANNNAGVVSDVLLKKTPSDISIAVHSKLMANGFTTALNIVEIGAVAIDKNGVIVHLNKVAETMFGYQSAEIMGQQISILIPPRFRADHHKYLKGFEAGPHDSILMGQRGEVFGYQKNGQEFPAEASITKYHIDDETYFVAMLREVTKYKKAEDELQWQASHDPLTKLPNRATLMERLDNALMRTRRSGGNIAVLFIDLDDFKFVNDSYGHSIGDQLLVAMAERLLKAIRAGDTVARFGGDEFVVLCERLENDTEAQFLAERINDELRQALHIDGMEFFSTCSIGVAISSDGDVSSKDLLSNADAAMYKAKEQGRNNWVSFNTEIHEKARERLDVANGLRTAIAKNELHCAYQPIVNTNTGKIAGMEALLRWSPEHGPVSPAVFIPIAEMTGTIVGLGAWVFREACLRQATLCQIFNEEDCPYVSVNVSPRQLEQPGFFNDICRIYTSCGADPKKIVIEITETALMADVEQNLRILNCLGDAGFGIAIDDFGTGYSSLALLTRMPLTILKVDREFVSKLETSKTDLAVATAVVSMAHALGLKVIAEGVENAAQHKILAALDTSYCQGYLFARPMPFEEIFASDVIEGQASLM